MIYFEKAVLKCKDPFFHLQRQVLLDLAECVEKSYKFTICAWILPHASILRLLKVSLFLKAAFISLVT